MKLSTAGRVLAGCGAVMLLLAVYQVAVRGCAGFWFWDVHSGWTWNEQCTVQGKLGWILYPTGGGLPEEPVCYDYRYPYCEMAVDPVVPSPEGACGDERDDIIAEYPAHGVIFRPFCSSFSNGGGWGNFPFSVLNDGDYNWAIVRNGILYERLDIAEEYMFWNHSALLQVTSGYRNPEKNAGLNPPGAANSRHLYGDAADLKVKLLDKCQYQSAVLQSVSLANASWTDTYSTCHVHADWRYF